MLTRPLRVLTAALALASWGCADDVGSSCADDGSCASGPEPAAACQGDACPATACVPTERHTLVATGVASSARSLWHDATHLYWIEGERVMTAAKNGSELRVAATVPGGVRTMAVGGGKLIVVTEKDPSILAIEKDGGAETTLAHDVGSGATALLVDGDDVLWAEGGAAYRVSSIATRGGQKRTLAQGVGVSGSDAVTWLGATEDDVYWVEAGEAGSAKAFRVAKSGGDAMSFKVPVAGNYAVDQEGFYFPDGTRGGFRVVARTGEVEKVAPDAKRIAVDERFIFFITSDKEHIHRVNLHPGRVVTMIANTASPGEMLLDDACVFWVDLERALLFRSFKNFPEQGPGD
jgi:hypothetical protein